jgi:hypothetical protein
MSTVQHGSVSQSLDAISDGDKNSENTRPTEASSKDNLRRVDTTLATMLSKNNDNCEICQEDFVVEDRIIERYCCHFLTHVSCLSKWVDAVPTKRRASLAFSLAIKPPETFSCPKCRRLASRAEYFEMLKKAFAPTPIPILVRTGRARNAFGLDIRNIIMASEQAPEEERERTDREATRISNTELGAGAEAGNAESQGRAEAGNLEQYTGDEISGEDDDVRNGFELDVEDGLMDSSEAQRGPFGEETEMRQTREERRSLIRKMRRRLGNALARLSEIQRPDTTADEDPAMQWLRRAIRYANARSAFSIDAFR